MACILVVDDDSNAVRILKDKLTAAGYDVIPASNGVEGYAKAKSERPDLILLDIMMPEVDGITVLQRLKFDPQTDSIPVIIMTAKGEKMENLAKMEGAVAYLTKPFVFSALLAEVQKCLGGGNPS